MLSRRWTRSLLDFCATGGARSAMACAVARIMLEHGDPSWVASMPAGREDALAGIGVREFAAGVRGGDAWDGVSGPPRRSRLRFRGCASRGVGAGRLENDGRVVRGAHGGVRGPAAGAGPETGSGARAGDARAPGVAAVRRGNGGATGGRRRAIPATRIVRRRSASWRSTSPAARSRWPARGGSPGETDGVRALLGRLRAGSPHSMRPASRPVGQFDTGAGPVFRTLRMAAAIRQACIARRVRAWSPRGGGSEPGAPRGLLYL